jgi:hypothetical protein
VVYEKATVTYFSHDDVLADERDARIDGIDEQFGLENLERFGHGSEDPNIVYIRNDKLQIDFEVVKSDGSFTAEVLGIDEDSADLQHSAVRMRPRRAYDDD